MRQEPDGTVVLRARRYLPGRKAKRCRRLAPGGDFQPIAGGIRLVVERGRHDRGPGDAGRDRLTLGAPEAPAPESDTTEADPREESYR